MFELSVASKYLIPRRRQLSVSIISLISILVIALVVWLIVVFFSVTDGLEKNWVQKLTTLTAPIRITPTEAYYHSYYHQIDSISHHSNYSPKSIREKLHTSLSDPYDPDMDEEIPSAWPLPDKGEKGNLKDLVQLAYASVDEIQHVPGLHAQDFELTGTHLHLNLFRPQPLLQSGPLASKTVQSALSYPAYLGNFEKSHSSLGYTLLPIESKDLNNLLFSITHPEMFHEELDPTLTKNSSNEDFKTFFNLFTIRELKTRATGWMLPASLLPKNAQWSGCALLQNHSVIRLFVPQKSQDNRSLQAHLEEQGLRVVPADLKIEEGTFTLSLQDGEPQTLSPRFRLVLAGNTAFSAQLERASLENATQPERLFFDIKLPIQGSVLTGKVPYHGLEIASVDFLPPSSSYSPLWIYKTEEEKGKLSFHLPTHPLLGEGVALPKSFRDAGVMIGDRGNLRYLAPTTSILQEQHVPIYVAGFYDPGIIPIGGKFILANPEVTALIRSSHQQEDHPQIATNGINVRFDSLNQAEEVKEALLNAFQAKGIQRYWNVETYREYEFTKEIMRELQSQKNLFMLIAVVIILVACSNIISMLIILVNDKKTEIGILRSMGASSKSIAFIFGFAGAMIGIVGSAIGITAAVLTLHYLDVLVYFLSKLQGHDMFNAHVYGQILPRELSLEALSFVLLATVCLSLLAGIIPAIKACLLRPSHILKAGN